MQLVLKKLREYFSVEKFKSMFFKYFIVFVFLVIFPAAILGTVAYKGFYDNLNDEIGKANAKTINKSLELIDIILNNVINQTDVYSADPNIVKYLVNPEDASMNLIGNIISQINTISELDYIQSVYIYNAFNGEVLSSDNVSENIESFYDTGWFDTYNEKKGIMAWEDTRKIISPDGETYNCITFVRNLPYSTAAPLGAIVVNIDENKLSELLAKQNDSDTIIYIVGTKGNIISHPDKKRINKKNSLPDNVKGAFKEKKNYYINKENGEDKIYAETVSDIIGWRYISESSVVEPIEEAEKTKRLTITVILLYVAIGFVFAFFMAKRFYSPIKNLINEVKKQSPNIVDAEGALFDDNLENEYKYLEKYYTHLKGINVDLEKSLKQSVPEIKDKYFNDILKGRKRVDTMFINQLSEKYFIDIPIGPMFVIVIEIDFDETEIELDKMNHIQINQKIVKTAKDVVKSFYEGHATLVDRNVIALVVHVDNAKEVMSATERLIEQIKFMVIEFSHLKHSIGVGKHYNSLKDLNFSYTEALEAIKGKFYHGYNRIIYYNKLENLASDITYDSIINEEKLYNFIMTNNRQSAVELIEKLSNEMRIKRVDENYAKQILSKLCVNLIEHFTQSNKFVGREIADMRVLFDKINASNTLDDIKKVIISLVDYMIDFFEVPNTNKSMDEIIDYIHNHYKEEISLTSVSDMVSLSPQYTSKIFRKYTGQNFTEYLALYRLKIAKEILLNENIPISELFEQAGFNNQQTFLRTFKKYEGITPSQFKKNYNS